MIDTLSGVNYGQSEKSRVGTVNNLVVNTASKKKDSDQDIDYRENCQQNSSNVLMHLYLLSCRVKNDYMGRASLQLFFFDQFNYWCKSLNMHQIKFHSKVNGIASKCEIILKALIDMSRSNKPLTASLESIATKLRGGDYTDNVCEISQSFAADVRACIAESARDDSGTATIALNYFNAKICQLCVISHSKQFWSGERIVYLDEEER